MHPGSTGFVFDVKRFAIHDGPGIRTTVFLKGCPLSCLGCHNPEGQRVGPELVFRPDRCTACGECVPACPNDAITMIGLVPGGPPGTEETGTGDEGGGGLSSRGGERNRPGKPGPISLQWDRCDLTGACVEACLPGALELVGRQRTVEEILAILEDDRIYFDESRGGVTFSGGEPFAQPHFLRDLLYACEEREIPVVLDTCGHVAPDTFRDLAPLAMHLLFDLKLMDRERHEAFTGVGNHWILENLSWVANGCKRVASSPGNEGELETAGEVMAGGGAGGGARGHSWSCPSLTVRVPLIPGVNDDSENLSATAEFLTGLTRVPPVDLLPYHRLGVEKYHRTGRPYSLSGVFPPTRDVVGRAVQLLEGAGLTVTVRGERYDHD